MHVLHVFFCSLMLAVVLGNIGFEYEFDVHRRKLPISGFGRLERQKPIATGRRGLWELQFDEYEEEGNYFVDCEIVFPPTRLYKGFPLNKAISTICPAQRDLSDYLSHIEHRTVNGVERLDVPYSDTILKRENKIMPMDLPKRYHYLYGGLQVTIGVHMDSCMDFFDQLLKNGHLFSPKKYEKVLYDVVTKMDLSNRAKALLFIISMYYINGNESEDSFTDVKLYMVFSSRTNLASLYSALSKEDKRRLDKGRLYSTVMKAAKESLSIEYSGFVIKNGFGEVEDETWEQGPTLFDFCNNLQQGIDMISALDDSMGYIVPTQSEEIVLELRDMKDFLIDHRHSSIPSHLMVSKILGRIKDLYQYFSLWEKGEPLPFFEGMGNHICEENERQEFSLFQFNHMISTNLKKNPRK